MDVVFGDGSEYWFPLADVAAWRATAPLKAGSAPGPGTPVKGRAGRAARGARAASPAAAPPAAAVAAEGLATFRTAALALAAATVLAAILLRVELPALRASDGGWLPW